jgi:hypothetical protein
MALSHGRTGGGRPAVPCALSPAALSRAAPRRARGPKVALLAGVGITWYTWLEQGRPINASDED